MKITKREVWVLVAFLSLLPICTFATDITFTSSGSIVEGNVFNNVYVQNSGTVVNMTGGQITERLSVRDYGTFNLSGGQLKGMASHINNFSTINVSGGTIDTGDFVVDGSANFSGGSITADRLKTYPASLIAPASVVNINGGILNFNMFDIHGTLNIYRGLLNVDDAYIGYEGIGQASINIYGSEFNYNPATQILTGHLLDNNLFTIKGVDATEYTRFNLIPEPISILLFGFGLAGLHKRK